MTETSAQISVQFPNGNLYYAVDATAPSVRFSLHFTAYKLRYVAGFKEVRPQLFHQTQHLEELDSLIDL